MSALTEVASLVHRYLAPQHNVNVDPEILTEGGAP